MGFPYGSPLQSCRPEAGRISNAAPLHVHLPVIINDARRGETCTTDCPAKAKVRVPWPAISGGLSRCLLMRVVQDFDQAVFQLEALLQQTAQLLKLGMQ